MSLNIKTATGLLEIGGQVTKEKIISALGYEPADKETIINNITEDESGNFNIVDESGNIIMRVDANGICTTEVVANGIELGKTVSEHTSNSAMHITSAERASWNNKSDFSGVYADLEGKPNITETESGNMVIADESGNVIMRVDADGVTTTNLNAKTIEINGEDLETRLKSASLTNILDNESGDFVIADETGNIILKVSDTGLETTQVVADTVVIDGVNVSEKLNNLFDGSYNSLTDIPTDLATESYVNTQVAALVDSSPETLNTLNELAAALGDDPNFAATVAEQIGLKASQADLDTHISNVDIHVTADEKTAWDNKSDFSGVYCDLTDAPNIVEDESGEVVYADEDGNIIFRIGVNGMETTAIAANEITVGGSSVVTDDMIMPIPDEDIIALFA